MILIGHPTGNPNSHNAALAYYESGRLEAFCVPWFPEDWQLNALRCFPGLEKETGRLARRRFAALASAPKIQGKWGEWVRLLRRAAGFGNAGLSYEANDWLMRTMAHAAKRAAVTAVHSFEDCSLWQFQEARRLGKQCIYDMPTCYYPWWLEKERQYNARFHDWAVSGKRSSSLWVRPEQKRQEMELADLVLAPSRFVERSIKEHSPDKNVAVVNYGANTEFWKPAEGRDEELKRPKYQRTKSEKIRFIYAGQSSIRKGIPVLMEAWDKTQLRDAELLLVGSWQLADAKLQQLPRGVRFAGPVGPEKLRDLYHESDVFVFPSLADGFGLVILEALACGLPVIATDSTGAPDVLDDSCGRVVQAGNVEQLAEILRWFAANRESLGSMRSAARAKAETFTWDSYRGGVNKAAVAVV